MSRSDRRPGYAWHTLGGHLDTSASSGVVGRHRCRRLRTTMRTMYANCFLYASC